MVGSYPAVMPGECKNSTPNNKEGDETAKSLETIDSINEAEAARKNINEGSGNDEKVNVSCFSEMTTNGISDQITSTNKHFEDNISVKKSLLVSNGVQSHGDLNTDIPMTKLQIWKNLIILSISFVLMFTSFRSMSYLQSSLNKEDGIGTASLAIVYASMIVSSMLLSPFFISHIGCKWAMCLSMITYVIYMTANLYPVWKTMVPGAVLCGLGAGPLWTSQSTYMTQLSRWYAKLTGNREKDVLSKFSGIFYMLVNSSNIWGNLLASLVLKQPQRTNKTMTTREIEDCVANDYNTVNNAENLERPDTTMIYMICGAWIGCAIVGIVVLIFLNPITTDNIGASSEGKRKIFTKVAMAIRHLLKSKLQKILIPFTMYYGFSQAFIIADFTKSLVGCTLGIQTIGSVMLCNGISCTIIIAVTGSSVKKVGQIPFFTMAFLFHGGVQISLIVWKPGPEHSYLFYIFVALWGIADAIIKSQMVALYGYLFVGKTEAAFGNYFMIESCGFIISLSYSAYLSTDIKLYIVFGLLICSVVSYFIVEYIDRSHSMTGNKGRALQMKTHSMRSAAN